MAPPEELYSIKQIMSITTLEYSIKKIEAERKKKEKEELKKITEASKEAMRMAHKQKPVRKVNPNSAADSKIKPMDGNCYHFVYGSSGVYAASVEDGVWSYKKLKADNWNGTKWCGYVGNGKALNIFKTHAYSIDVRTGAWATLKKDNWEATKGGVAYNGTGYIFGSWVATQSVQWMARGLSSAVITAPPCRVEPVVSAAMPTGLMPMDTTK